MAILRVPIEITSESEAPYLEQDETGDLSGISGTLEIDNDNGVHSYVLDYRLL